MAIFKGCTTSTAHFNVLNCTQTLLEVSNDVAWWGAEKNDVNGAWWQQGAEAASMTLKSLCNCN